MAEYKQAFTFAPFWILTETTGWALFKTEVQREEKNKTAAQFWKLKRK